MQLAVSVQVSVSVDVLQLGIGLEMGLVTQVVVSIGSGTGGGGGGGAAGRIKLFKSPWRGRAYTADLMVVCAMDTAPSLPSMPLTIGL